MNAHTVKGAARSIGLSKLAIVIHELESKFTDIIKHNIKVPYTTIKDYTNRTLECLHEYEFYNTSKLGRKNQINEISIDRHFLETHYYEISNLIEGNAAPDMHKILGLLKKQSKFLTSIVFEKLDELFEDYQTKADKIAIDLGKEKPKFDIDLAQVSIASDLRTTLDNAMIHILRNSLDHGIETAEERIKKAKSPEGLIKISAYKDSSNYIHIVIGDDGRGLNLAVLRKKASTRGFYKTRLRISKLQSLSFTVACLRLKTSHSTLAEEWEWMLSEAFRGEKRQYPYRTRHQVKVRRWILQI